MSVPAENRPIAATNIVRVVKRRSRKPVIGMTTAIVSMNAVVSHCAASAVMPRSMMRCGIATPIVVSLRIATKAAAEQQPDDAALSRAELEGRRRRVRGRGCCRFRGSCRWRP